jgi:ribosomal protein S6
MNETKEDRKSIYEIGFEIVASVPEENVESETSIIRNVITGSGASIIAEEAPHRQPLAYTIKKKTVSGSYEKFDQAYFGWIKFEVESSKIGTITKAIENHPSILRSIVISTVRENTYLGKRASAIIASLPYKPEQVEVKAEKHVEDKKEVAPMSVEDVDKSIDEMVKEA